MKHKTKKSSGHNKKGGKSKNHSTTTKSGEAKVGAVEKDRKNKKNWVDDHWCWMPVPEPPQQIQNQSNLQSSPPPLLLLSPQVQSDPPITTTTTTTQTPHNISIVSWNVLANSYCNSRSHRHLPLKVQRHVFDRPQRQHHVRQILRRLVASPSSPSPSPLLLQADLVALQEVDEPLHVHEVMTGELEMDGIETPTTPSGNDGRVDACALYYKRSIWKKLQHQVIRLDDLATLMSSTIHPPNGPSDTTTASSSNSSSSTTTTTSTTHSPNLQGIQTSLMRNNMALLVQLQHLQDPNLQIVVVVVHLYWNPLYEYIKVRNEKIRSVRVVVVVVSLCCGWLYPCVVDWFVSCECFNGCAYPPLSISPTDTRHCRTIDSHTFQNCFVHHVHFLYLYNI
jgi:hypothetical protein